MKIESEIKNGCEKTKEEQLTDLVKKLEDDYQGRRQRISIHISNCLSRKALRR
jgi:hypothetical protein